MVDRARLTAPLCEVVMDDGATWQVQAVNRDLVLWDRTRPRQRPVWPTLDEAPFLWLTFVSWAASRREGLTQLDYEAWESACLSATAVPDDDTEAGPGDPTRPGAGPE